MGQHAKEINDENFEKVVLQSEVPVLVDFWAAWYGPCLVLAPAIEAVAEEHAARARVVKLNGDDNPSFTRRYDIRGMPTIILFKGGEERERLIGVVSKEEISQKIDKHLNKALN
jgi:thioredoxin 1